MERNNVLTGKDRPGLGRTQASGASGIREARTQKARLRWALPPGLGTALLYLASMALTEALIALAAPLAGIVLYSLLMLAMIMHSSLGASGTRKRFLLALALVPLIRVLTLSIPQFEFPPLVRYLLVGVPIFAGAVLAIRENQLSRSMVGLVPRGWPVQILVGSTGVALGYLEYLILRPAPLVAEFRWELIWLPALVLVLFSGLLEELIFRGIIQYTALSSLGRFSLIYVPAVFTILYLGQRPPLDILFLFAMAVFYGWIVLRTGSILGVTLSHALVNAALFLVFPFLLAAPPGPSQFIHPNILGIGDLELQKTGLATGTPAVPTTIESSGILTGTAEVVVSPEIMATITLIPSETASPTLTSSPTETASPSPTSSPTAQPTELPPTGPPPAGGPAPEAPACGAPAGWVSYVVRPGDSLYVLSRTLGVSVAQLMEANCLNDPSRIYAGQRLYVPYLPPVLPPTPVPVLPTPTLRPTDPPPPTAEIPTQVPTPVPTEPPSEAPPTPAPTQPPATEAPPPPPPEPIPTEVPPPTEVIITTEAPLP